MIDLLQKHIKTNIAQYTHLFNIETQSITATLNSNIISNTGLSDGEWTLSGAVDGVASKGVINSTYEFEGGQVNVDNFLGKDNLQMDLIAQKVNVGTAIARDAVLQMVKDKKVGNCIIVYSDTARNISKSSPSKISENTAVNVLYTIGVLFKIEATQMESIGCTNTDIVFIRSVLGIGKDTGTLIKFENVKSRFFAGNDYCVEFEFSYEDIMELDDTIIDRLKHYDAEFTNLTTK